MSEEKKLVIEVTKGEVKYKMLYSETQNNWGVFLEAYDDSTCIARFKSVNEAKSLMTSLLRSV